MSRHKFVKPAVVRDRIAELPVSPGRKEELRGLPKELVAERRAQRRPDPKKK
jgi:hypothetical protein